MVAVVFSVVNASDALSGVDTGGPRLGILLGAGNRHLKMVMIQKVKLS